MKKVSIIIPAYNREAIIGETLDSIISQTYQDWECLIVDDHSTDGTKAKILEYISKDSRFILITNEKTKGAQGSRNTGLEHARGEFIIFLDSDDLLSEDCLLERFNFACMDPNYNYYCFPTAVFKKQPFDTDFLWNYLNKPENDLIRFLKTDMPWHTSGVLWRKNTLTLLNGWDEKISCWQDWDIHLRALIDPKLKFRKSSNENVDSFYRVDGTYNAISTQAISNNSIRSKIYLIDKFLVLLPLELETVRLEFARLIYRISLQIIEIKGKKEAISFFNNYIKKGLKFPKYYILLWQCYLYYKYDPHYPSFLLKPLGIIPRIFKNKSLLENKRTHLSAKFQ